MRIRAVTTCPHWDMHILGGQPMLPGLELAYPYMMGQPGHEACGEVVSVGADVQGLTAGQRVCVWRDAGHQYPGCYAECVVKNAADLIPIPAEGADEDWAPLELAMCVSAHVMLAEKLDALAGQRVAVFGLGASGLVCVQLVRAAGAAEIIGVDPSSARRQLALTMGADAAYGPEDAALARMPEREQPGAIDTAFDCVGAPAVVHRAMDLASKLVVLFAVQRQPYTFEPRHWGRLILAGTQAHTREAAEYARDRVADGRLKLAPLVTQTMPLSEYGKAVELLRNQQAIKVAFLPQMRLCFFYSGVFSDGQHDTSGEDHPRNLRDGIFLIQHQRRHGGG